MSGKDFASAPAQKRTGEKLDNGHQRPQDQVDPPEWPRQHEAEPVRKQAKKHFRQQVKKGVKEENNDGKNRHEDQVLMPEDPMQFSNHPAKNDEISYGIADQDGPKKVFWIFEI